MPSVSKNDDHTGGGHPHCSKVEVRGGSELRKEDFSEEAMTKLSLKG